MKLQKIINLLVLTALTLISSIPYRRKNVLPLLAIIRFHSSRHILAIFTLKNRTFLKNLYRMPCSLRYLHTILSLRRTKFRSECLLELSPRSASIHIHIKYHIQPPLQTHHSLAGLLMPMYRHLRPNLQRI